MVNSSRDISQADEQKWPVIMRKHRQVSRIIRESLSVRDSQQKKAANKLAYISNDIKTINTLVEHLKVTLESKNKPEKFDEIKNKINIYRASLTRYSKELNKLFIRGTLPDKHDEIVKEQQNIEKTRAALNALLLTIRIIKKYS